MQTEAGANMPEHTYPSCSDSDANFIGWQETLSGGPFPLFNITVADHPLYQSAVSDETLRRLLLRVVPQTHFPYQEPDLAPMNIERNGNNPIMKEATVIFSRMEHDQPLWIRDPGFLIDPFKKGRELP